VVIKKEDNIMPNRVFTGEEMENMFEIGRQIQAMIDADEIEVEDSREAYSFALELSLAFEKEFPETEDYYGDLYEFIVEKILDRFGVEK
jgi:hypothetical protein